MKKLGFIVNPVAGIGGKVGLKGSDGAATLKKALDLGAVPESGKKALVTMKALAGESHNLDIYTYPGEMGEDICKAAGLDCTVLGHIDSGHTTPEDTMRAAVDLRDAGMDLILFAGGDGTARNVLDAVGTTIPVLGIPTGCKIHSGVYAVNPKTAGMLMGQYAEGKVRATKEAEVMDIDEDLFRQNIVQARLYGYLNVLDEKRLVQNLKSGRVASGPEAIGQIAVYFRETLEPDTLYVMGTGSTVAVLMKELGLPNTLLGVDLVYNGPAPAGASSSDIDTSAPADASASDHQDPAPSGASSSDTGTSAPVVVSDTGPHLIASDCTEAEILDALDKYPRAKIVVTVIGGQGYIFGRGNQQLSAEVIRRVGTENIIIAAGKEKVMLLPGFELHADTGDESINQMLSGYRQVIVGYEEKMVMKVTV